jgi:hypothetical protein
LAGGAGGNGVDVSKADIVAVETVGLIDFEEAGVVRFDENDVDALEGGSLVSKFP